LGSAAYKVKCVRLMVKGDGNIRSECEEDKGTDCDDGDRDIDW